MISIVIPTYRDWPRLQLCLNALTKQTISSAEFEIIVVNNNSEESLPHNFSLPSNAVVIHEPTPGSYAARNRALRVAQGQIIGFTDSDCVPDIDWISNAVRIMDFNNEVDRLAGAVKVFREANSSWLAWKFESITAFNQRHNVINGVSVTANLFVRRAVFDKVGLFDASLYSGGDIAWNKFASKNGATLIYSDQVIVKHPARSSMCEIVNKSRRIFGSNLIQARREGKWLICVLKLMLPPLKYAQMLRGDGKSISSVFFACAIYWGIKLLMLMEFVRLISGGRSVR